MTPTHLTAETVARDSYGRLVAYLAARCRDVSTAEDALSDAFRSALEQWPRDGVPTQPEAWLLTVAKRRLLDQHRHQLVHDQSQTSLQLLLQDDRVWTASETIPDERLQLLFLCAHPAIDPDSRTPLMLQTVLGLDAARIASAFLVTPSSMSQRLVRAKNKIRDAAIPFHLPEPAVWPERLDAVLDAIYAAYGTGWEIVDGADGPDQDLTEEAIWLTRVLVQRLPDEAEARGLLALMLYCQSRRAARRSPTGDYVPLADQDPALWNPTLIAEAEHHLSSAARHRHLGRYQLEAAIQSAHTERRHTRHTNWSGIALLYAGLVHLAPSLGARVSHAAACAQALDPTAALTLLNAIDPALVTQYQPYWAVRAAILQQLGHHADAQQAYQRAIGLTEDAAVRRFLLAKSQASR